MAEGSGLRWLLVLGSLVVLLTVGGVLIYTRSVRMADPTPVVPVGGGSFTARQAFDPAAELAAQWQEDAGLVAVSGRWSAVGTQLGEQVEWAFQFFSPVAQGLAIVAVNEGTARMVHQGVSPYAVPTFSVEEWVVDSDLALQTWWRGGGGGLVARRPDTDLAMQLHVPLGKSGPPVWTVVGVVPGTETAFTVEIRATDGALVEE